jgi:hypothetical protein
MHRLEHIVNDHQEHAGECQQKEPQQCNFNEYFGMGDFRGW